MPKRKVHKKDIISAAFRLFATQGFAGTSMADIAKECGLLKGSIYHYFDSKESLIEAVLQSSMAYKSLGMMPILLNEDIPPRDRLVRFLRSISTDQPGNLIMSAVMELGSDQRYRQHLVQFYNQWIKAVSQLLPGDGESTEDAVRIVEEIQGAFILSMVHRDPTYVEACSENLIKRSFGD